MVKNLPIILSWFTKILTHYSYFIPIYHLLFLLILVIFIVSMIIMCTIHMVTYIGQQDVVIADFLQNLHEILLPLSTSISSPSLGLRQICRHNNKHNGLACYTSIIHRLMLSNRTISVKHTIKLTTIFSNRTVRV